MKRGRESEDDSGSTGFGRKGNSNNSSTEGTNQSSRLSAHGSSFEEGGLGVDERRLTRRPWSAKEDDMLRRAVQTHGGSQWKEIAKLVPGRSHVQCLQRWNTSLHPDVIKGRWTTEEDHLLLEIVSNNPHLKNWGFAAKLIPGRTAKQCRERYTHHLDPSIKKGDWTKDEDMFISESHKRLGNRWAEIATHLPGRTENSIKIRLSILKKRERKLARATNSALSSNSVDSGRNSIREDNNAVMTARASKERRVQRQVHLLGPREEQDIKIKSEAGAGPATAQKRRLERFGSGEQKYSFGFESDQPFVDPNHHFLQPGDHPAQHQHHYQDHQHPHPYQRAFGTNGNNLYIQVPGILKHAQETDPGPSPPADLMLGPSFFASSVYSPLAGYLNGGDGGTSSINNTVDNIVNNNNSSNLDRQTYSESAISTDESELGRGPSSQLKLDQAAFNDYHSNPYISTGSNGNSHNISFQSQPLIHPQHGNSSGQPPQF